MAKRSRLSARGYRLSGRAVALIAPLAGCASGCAGPARNVARETAPPAAIATLQSMNQPAGHEALQGFIAAIADGALDALADPRRQARVARVSSALGDQVGGSVLLQLQSELPPVARTAAHAAIDAALEQAGSESAKGRSEELIANLSRAAVGAAVQELGTELRAGANATPGGQRPAGTLHDAVGGLSREASRQIVLGIHDGLVEVERTASESQGLRPLVKGPPTTEILVYIALGLVEVIIVLAVWIGVIKHRDRRHSRELHERESVLWLVSQALRSSRDQAWVREVKQALLSEARNRGEVRSLRSLLDDELPAERFSRH